MIFYPDIFRDLFAAELFTRRQKVHAGYLRLMVLAGMLALMVDGGAHAQDSLSRLSMGADFLYRVDFITAEHQQPRNRQQFQVHARLNYAMQDNLTFIFQLRSGDTDPVAAKQAFTGGFSAKPVEIDIASMNWRPVEGLRIISGKMQNPFYAPRNTKLMWDVELRPEGVSANYTLPAGAVDLFLNASHFWIQERSSNRDAMLSGGQARVQYQAEPARIMLGAGYYDYRNTKGFPTFYTVGDGVGNSLDASNNYLYDFNNIELMSEITFSGLPLPLAFYGDYILNIADDVTENQAWIAGLALGDCAGQGDFALYYSFRRLERDSLMGAFNDSCFLGGGTNGKGHEMNAEYQVSEKVSLYATWFISRLGLDDGIDYNRVQMDFNYVY